MSMLGICALARMAAGDFREALPDANILALARRGDPSALDELVRRYQSRIYNLAYRMLRQREDAEDVTQEAFLKAFEALPRLKDDAAFRAWLSRIAANLCLMRLRSRSHAEAPWDAVAQADQASQHDATPEIIERLRTAMAELPPKHRLAVVAFYIEGRSYNEAARLAGVPVLTFKTRLYRARRMLRDMLSDALAAEKESMP
jgi:RNA polymerase sigma-70 factor (ECF subfamily)